MTTPKKFIIVAHQQDIIKHTVILSEWQYWSGSDTYEELKTWCKNKSIVIKGMTIGIPNDQLLTEFILRWS
jgi:hypothetical protein